MPAIDAMGDTGNVGVGEGGLQEIKLAGTGVPVAEGDVEHGAVVLGDDERANLAPREIGQVTVLVQDLGDHPHRAMLQRPIRLQDQQALTRLST